MTEPADDRMRFMDDDGNELNPDLIRKPALCVSCAKDADPSEEIVCCLLRVRAEERDVILEQRMSPHSAGARCCSAGEDIAL